MKRILFIFLALAVFAGLEAGAMGEDYEFRSADRYLQESPSHQANHTLLWGAGRVEVGDSATRDNDRVVEQRGDEEEGNGGDADEEDDNGDENGKGDGSNRFWDVAEFG